MDEDAFREEVRRLNPGRDDIKVEFRAGMPVFEYSNRLGMPKLPRPKPAPKPDGA